MNILDQYHDKKIYITIQLLIIIYDKIINFLRVYLIIIVYRDIKLKNRFLYNNFSIETSVMIVFI